MTHFTDAELLDWAGRGPGTSDASRVREHLAVCGACAARYASAIRERNAAPDDVSLESDPAFAQAGYRVPARVAWRQRGMWIGGLAAAAALLLAIGTLPHPWVARPAATPSYRGASVVALAPAGPIVAGTAFEWSLDVAGTSRFRIDIGDSQGIVLAEPAAVSPARLPDADWQHLKPGIDYWWRVTAVDANGREIATSARRAFTIRPR